MSSHHSDGVSHLASNISHSLQLSFSFCRYTDLGVSATELHGCCPMRCARRQADVTTQATDMNSVTSKT
jgi:hypothetical protein